ncbi:MAG: D-alanyl-D-alanine carboxypeptidase [Actinobacteria bacterium]|nr:D-alanyl-D-alanine carboxypeptidase [Actinomycetota bacterium]MBL7123272.1 D-alanyl-D-alanine carboxypeptidase [Actinomycetota bacterium]
MINTSPSVLIHKNLKAYRIFIYLLIFLILFSVLFFLNPDKVYCDSDDALYDDEIDIVAESAVIVNYETGDILWEKNSSKLMYPASTTKMFSSIVAIENIDNFEEIIKISKNASGRNHSAFRFRTGDKISLIDLLKAALIYSINNAPVALAEYVSGNVEDFVKLMNIKAKEIDAENSSFHNTNGLDDKFPDHKSTAIDLAKIASYCMKNELFREIVSMREATIKINDKEIEITNTNKLLDYDYIKGIKTGLTNNAGFCVVLYSEKENLKLITVILNDSSQDNRDKDALKLLSWAYDNLKYVKIIDSEQPAVTVNTGEQTVLNIDLYPDTDYIKLININSDAVDKKNKINNNITLPVEKNKILGSMDVFINDEKLTEINLISRENIGSCYIYQELSDAGEIQSRIVLIFLLVFYFLIFIFIIVRNLLTKKIV